MSVTALMSVSRRSCSSWSRLLSLEQAASHREQELEMDAEVAEGHTLTRASTLGGCATSIACNGSFCGPQAKRHNRKTSNALYINAFAVGHTRCNRQSNAKWAA